MGSEYSSDEVTPYSKSFSVFGLKYSSIRIITGRNEVLAKVIFSQACVCPQGGGVWSGPGGGVSNFSGGSPIFRGGRGCVSFFQCVITCATLQFDINLFQLVEIWCALWMNVQDYTLLRDKLFHGSVMLQETFAVVGLVYPLVLKLSKKCSKC